MTLLKILQDNHGYLLATHLYLKIKELNNNNYDITPKTSRKYTGQFIRLNLRLVYGMSSSRFGGFMTKFSFLMKEYGSELANYTNQISQLVSEQRAFFSKHKDFGEFVNLLDVTMLTEMSQGEYWVSSHNLRLVCSHLKRSETNRQATMNLGFAKTFTSEIDWTEPHPIPTFPQYIIINEFVENMHGYWVPQFNNGLADVGFLLFTNNEV